MSNQDFDRLLNSIREDVPAAETIDAAAQRVHDKLGTAGPNGICSQFRADFDAYRAGTLPDARRMLLEDHLHSCVACRREYSGTGASVVMMPKRAPVAIRRAGGPLRLLW